MIRAVICDDEDAALKIITYSIENQGIPIEIVGTASDGKEALALIKKENPNLVFLDIEMPGMNGFDVVEKMNAVNCKVIIITAYSTFSYAQRALRLGVSDIIEKPIDTDTLKEAIQRAIGWEFSGNEALNKALFYIHTHYWEKIELEILAEEACCTPSHLSHLFRNLLDTSAILYLHKVRIHEAVKKLNSGEEVKDVAYAVGYSSMNNFYKYFKLYRGETPAAFKKRG